VLLAFGVVIPGWLPVQKSLVVLNSTSLSKGNSLGLSGRFFPLMRNGTPSCSGESFPTAHSVEDPGLRIGRGSLRRASTPLFRTVTRQGNVKSGSRKVRMFLLGINLVEVLDSPMNPIKNRFVKSFDDGLPGKAAFPGDGDP
jgi:hypothetical protein